MKHIEKETLGTYGLIIVALFWGLGFPALKVVSATIPTFYLIGLRFLMATSLLGIIFHRNLKQINKALIRSAFILSIVLFLAYVFATLGIQYTTSAKASFFSCLGLLIIPVLQRMLYKETINKRVAISIIICTIGLFLISYTKGMGFRLATGDIICLGCSVAGALHVVFTGRVANHQDPALLATVQLFFISIWSFITALLLEDFPKSIPYFHWWVLIFLAIFCTAISFVLQAACQRYINPSRAGVIFAIEPVSGAIFSAFLLGDHLGINGIIGGAMIFSSLIFMESKAKETDVSLIPISENMPLQEPQEQCDTSQRL
ncbi:MAG: DMT family transporter [Bacillota bacterium]